MQFSANSSRLFHHTSESFSKRKDICFLMAASVWSRWLDIGRVLFYNIFFIIKTPTGHVLVL